MFQSDDEAAGYLAGIIDGEGHVAFRHYKRNRYKTPQLARFVQIINTDMPILEACAAALDRFNISHAWRTRRAADVTGHFGQKPIHELRIGREVDLRRLADVVTLRCDYKREALENIVGSYRAKPRWDEAAELYGRFGRIEDVAEAMGIPKSTAQLWIKKAGTAPKQSGRPRGRKWSAGERRQRLDG